MDVENSNNIQTPYDNEKGNDKEEGELDLDAMGGASSSSHQDDSFLM